MPVFIASDPKWAARFAKAGIPIAGDDIKAQVGATIVHRTLTRLFVDRGVKLDRTYQLNTGGNTDFLNMLNHERLESKRISKTDAVQSQLPEPLAWENIHIGPSDYVPWQNDNKVCFLRMEGREFAGVPMQLELRLSVEDSPNSAGVVVDVIRCVKLARDREDGRSADVHQLLRDETSPHPVLRHGGARPGRAVHPRRGRAVGGGEQGVNSPPAGAPGDCGKSLRGWARAPTT